MNFKTFAVAASFAAIGATLPTAAQAFTFSAGSSINVVGTAEIVSGAPGDDIVVDLSDAEVESFTGDFALATPLSVGAEVGTEDLNLDFVRGPGPAGIAFIYEGSAANPFFDFGEQTIGGTTADLTFVVDNPFELSVLFNFDFGFVESITSINAFTGSFIFDGETEAVGLLTFNQFVGTPGSFSATIEAVPEPFTMLGSAAALGLGGLLERKRRQAAANN